MLKRVMRNKVLYIKLTYINKIKIDTVKVIKEVELKKPITYKAGATSDSKLAKEWMEFLKSDKAKEILKRISLYSIRSFNPCLT